MTTRSTERKQFLFYAFVAALEGGIGYWSLCHEYHALTPDKKDDLDGFFAIIEEAEEGSWEFEGQKPRVRVDIDTIAKGVGLIVRGEVQIADRLRKQVVAADALNDAGDIDAELADCIVQAAVLGDLVYG